MSAADEAAARKALTWRLNDWGVAEPAPKARLFIDELMARGWRMSPSHESRPVPPKPEEACRTCGRALHAPDVVCDRPTTRPLASVPPPVTYLEARRSRPAETETEENT